MLCFALLWTAAIAAQQGGANATPQSPADAAQPAAEHRELAALAGRWNLQVTYNAGGGKTMTATGTAENRMVLGGRFLISESTSSVPAGAPAGMKAIDSMRIYGFDRRTSTFTIVELDSMGTYWVTAAGTKKEAGMIVMSGETLDDHGGTREMRQYDMVLRVIDRDTYAAEVVFKFANRAPVKLVEILHTRVK
jgi:hypothetical protein